MGTKAVDALEISFEDMPMYLRAKHSVYMDVNGASYYLTDVNDRYWRAQDTSRKNEKGTTSIAATLCRRSASSSTFPLWTARA